MVLFYTRLFKTQKASFAQVTKIALQFTNKLKKHTKIMITLPIPTLLGYDNYFYCFPTFLVWIVVISCRICSNIYFIAFNSVSLKLMTVQKWSMSRLLPRFRYHFDSEWLHYYNMWTPVCGSRKFSERCTVAAWCLIWYTVNPQNVRATVRHECCSYQDAVFMRVIYKLFCIVPTIKLQSLVLRWTALNTHWIYVAY